MAYGRCNFPFLHTKYMRKATHAWFFLFPEDEGDCLT